MDLGVGRRTGMSAGGAVALVCAWVVYKRYSSHLRENVENNSGRSLEVKHEPGNRPPIDILYPHANSQDDFDAEIDLVVVHGLGSSADWSWIHQDPSQLINGKPKCVNWLCDDDMLPEILPKARILSFNYQSRWHWDASKTRLQVCGEELVNALHDFRRDMSDRPIVYIGHSLGGNVIQHGLLYSESEPKFKYLVELTVGLAFLGCPFKGSKIQGMASLVTQVLQIAGSDAGIIRDLTYGDPVLIDKVNSFQRLLERNNIPFCSFIERKLTNYGKKANLPTFINIGFINDLVVDEESAGALGPHKIHLDSDHFKLNKYSGPQDRSFLAVSAQLRGMASNWRPLLATRMSGSTCPGVQRKLLENKQRHETIVKYLARFDFSERYKDVLSIRHKNTGLWFVSSETFIEWRSAPGHSTWCFGIPGAGKTTLFALAVNHLQGLFKNETILFAFCDYKDRRRQSAENILFSLWRQLMRNRLLNEAECEALEIKYIKKGVSPTTEALMNILSDELNKYSRVFILIDALDELEAKSRDSLMYLLSKLPTHRNLLITSRIPKDTTSPFTFGDISLLEIRAKEADIIDYIDGRIQASPRFASKLANKRKLRQQIRDTIVKKTDGMFLLATLHLNALLDSHTIKDIQSILKSIPAGENAISRTYEDAILRIRQQGKLDRELGQKIILWIAYAKRPLTLKDLQAISTLKNGDTDLDLDDLVPEELMTSTCAGLVTVEAATGRIQFVHSTAQEHIDSIKAEMFPRAEILITESCIQYLSLSMFRVETHMFAAKKFMTFIAKYPFVEYAALYWGDHAQHCDNRQAESHLRDKIEDFLSLKHQSSFAIRTLLCAIAGFDGAEMGANLAKNDRAIKMINILAYFGLDWFITRLLSSEPDVLVTSFDGFVGNVLHWAALGQHSTTLKLLLDSPSASSILDQKGYWASTPLYIALSHGRNASAEALLLHGADVALTAHFGYTPLLVAAINGNGAIIPKILATDRGIDTLLMQGHAKTTAFCVAATRGHTEVMIQLLHALEVYGLDKDLTRLDDNWRRNPLHTAAAFGHLNVSMLLLRSKYGAHFVNSRDVWGVPPIVLAIHNGHVEVTELFLTWNNGILLSGENKLFATEALGLAAHYGQPLVANMLLDRHPAACQANFQLMTALHHAAYSGSLETVKVILSHSIGQNSLEARDKFGDTPVIGASARGQTEIVEYLLENGASVDAKNDKGETALYRACESNVRQVVKVLLRAGANPNVHALNGQTALMHSIECDAPDSMSLLLNKGAKIPDGLVIPETGPWKKATVAKRYYPETPSHQFEAYYYLKIACDGRIPGSILSHILDHAKYWLLSEIERCEHKTATNFHGPTLVYACSPPIFGNRHYPVRRIEHEIISHDQGYSGEPHLHGSYGGSYTWFDDIRECPPGPFHETARRFAGPEVLRNIHAESTWQKHRVSWCCIDGERNLHIRTDDDTNEEIEDSVLTVPVNPRAPKSLPLQWIFEMHPGDRILLTVRAHFPGWENHIRRAKLVVYTSCLKASSYIAS